MLKISLALPGAERKRTIENAPATAIPLPRLPFTSIIITWTITGRSAVVTAKLFDEEFLNIWARDRMRPQKSDTAVHIAKALGVIPEVIILEKIELSTIISP